MCMNGRKRICIAIFSNTSISHGCHTVVDDLWNAFVNSVVFQLLYEFVGIQRGLFYSNFVWCINRESDNWEKSELLLEICENPLYSSSHYILGVLESGASVRLLIWWSFSSCRSSSSERMIQRSIPLEDSKCGSFLRLPFPKPISWSSSTCVFNSANGGRFKGKVKKTAWQGRVWK